jgi:hypothetical protein
LQLTRPAAADAANVSSSRGGWSRENFAFFLGRSC